jgi:DNA helicase HerA-like ATPase
VRNQGRVIIAAGELSKLGSKIVFNLESGTYTRNIMSMTRNYMKEANYIRLVKNALRTNMNYVKNILVPKIPASLGNLVARGNISFYFGEPSAKTRAKVMANLKKAGLTTNSARNLILKLIEGGAAK